MPAWNVVTVGPIGTSYRLQGYSEPKARALYAATKPRKPGQSIALTQHGKVVESKHYEEPAK